tara:strand:- start:113 stop:439 length:327 start_codon:yes stop_codon:yes gene_type:complete
MIDTDKYTELTIDDWYNLKAHQWEEVMHSYCNLVRVNESLRFELDGKHEDGLKWIEKCEELDTEVKRLHDGIRSILSDYDITELIRDVPEDEWNFEQQALIRMKEMIE